MCMSTMVQLTTKISHIVHLDPLEEKHTRGGGGGGGERVDGGGGGVPALARPPCVFVFL